MINWKTETVTDDASENRLGVIQERDVRENPTLAQPSRAQLQYFYNLYCAGMKPL